MVVLLELIYWYSFLVCTGVLIVSVIIFYSEIKDCVLVGPFYLVTMVSVCAYIYMWISMVWLFMATYKIFV